MLGVGPSRAAAFAILALLVLAALGLVASMAFVGLTMLCTAALPNLSVFQTCMSTSSPWVVVGIGLILAVAGLAAMIWRRATRARRDPGT